MLPFLFVFCTVRTLQVKAPRTQRGQPSVVEEVLWGGVGVGDSFQITSGGFICLPFSLFL